MPTMTIAIAGASGFVGSHLIPELVSRYRVIALGRHKRAPNQALPAVEWRRCDLFSSQSADEALVGVNVAIYLVHSMMPSSRLFQGSFHDTDLFLADNFANSCAKNGVQHIIYLGGLMPEEGYVSPHLRSRCEVEGVLQASGIPVTRLRAGMVVGPGGSSFEILRSLVERLPLMILPRWTQSRGQAIFVDDVVRVIEAAITNPSFADRTVAVVNGESLTYEMMLRQTAAALGKKRRMWRVPITSTGFSKRWVQIFGRASQELVSPLIDSLQCDLPQWQPEPEIAALVRYRRFAEMLEKTVWREQEPVRRLTRKRPSSTVRSIQRLPTMGTFDAHRIASEYMAWLPRFFRTVVRVNRVDGSDRVIFSIVGWRWPLLVLDHVTNIAGRENDTLEIVGGALSKRRAGWLSFAKSLNANTPLPPSTSSSRRYPG